MDDVTVLLWVTHSLLMLTLLAEGDESAMNFWAWATFLARFLMLSETFLRVGS
jgi:hypothetical protein